MLAEFFAALAIALLRYLQQRGDLKAALRADLEREAFTYVEKALRWKAVAAGDLNPPELLVRKPGVQLWLSNDDADPGRVPAGGALPSKGWDRTDSP